MSSYLARRTTRPSHLANLVSGGPVDAEREPDTWLVRPEPAARSAGLRDACGGRAAAARDTLLRSSFAGATVADRLGGGPIPPEVLLTLRRSAGGGRALPSPVAASAGAVLGADLSGVRLHTDSAADGLARSVQSVAFTQGRDIYFSRGSYAPHSGDGSRLLGHELAHVAQQSSGGAGTIGRASDPSELAADRAADTIAPALRRSLNGSGTHTALPGDPQTANTPSAAGGQLAGGRVSGVQRSVLRRRISATSATIAAVRGKDVKKKGALSTLTGAKDSLYKVGVLLDRQTTLSLDQQAQILNLSAIVALSKHWLKRHQGGKDRAMAAMMEDISAEANRDLGQARAQQRYVNDLRAGELSGVGAKTEHQPTTTPLTQQLTMGMAGNAQRSMEAATSGVQYSDLDVRKAMADLVRSAGLSEAEVAAIKLFTSNDFMYLNPAVANSPGWMAAQMGTINMMAGKVRSPGTDAAIDPKQMRAEGVTHAGVMMQGLAKMEPKKGTVYRGARMAPAEFDNTYGKQSHITYSSFVSSAVKSLPTEAYARGAGAVPPRADQTVSVKCIFEVDDARDLRALSEVASEEEWLLLPGATFAITKIEDETNGLPGRPAATAWKVVHLKQVKSKPAVANGNAAKQQPGQKPLPKLPTALPRRGKAKPLPPVPTGQ